MSNNKIRDLENKIFELMQELQKLQKENVKQEVKNYDFTTLNGNSNLLDFFESGEYEYYTDLADCASPQYATFFKMYTLTNADIILVDGSPPVVLLDDTDLNIVEAGTKRVDIKDYNIEKKHYQ